MDHRGQGGGEWGLEANLNTLKILLCSRPSLAFPGPFNPLDKNGLDESSELSHFHPRQSPEYALEGIKEGHRKYLFLVWGNVGFIPGCRIN